MNKSVGLKFYIDNNISPVHQDISDLEKHFQVRSSLYRLLGLPSHFFRSQNILEVAAGSGHNSLFISSLIPNSYDICEPNPIAVQDIKNLYNDLSIPHTRPRIFTQRLEDFLEEESYDIVICEGWLGGLKKYEQDMLKKLARFVVKDGILILTFFPPIGGISSFLRRLMAFRIISIDDDINSQTEILCSAFSSHLNTLSSISRTHQHWLQDCLLNPHIYVGPLSPNICFDVLGNEFAIYNSVPKLAHDWRWYKSLYGNSREFNLQFLKSYDAACHNLIDYRFVYNNRDINDNRKLESLCFDLIKNAKRYDTSGYSAYKEHIAAILKSIIDNIDCAELRETTTALSEAAALLECQHISPEAIANMKYFSSLFGREQCYMSFIRY